MDEKLNNVITESSNLLTGIFDQLDDVLKQIAETDCAILNESIDNKREESVNLEF